MRLRLVLALLFAVTLAQPAAAQTRAEKARATAMLKKGATLLDKKQFAEALEQFEQAFAIVPSAKIQFNLGLAYEGLGRYTQAWEAYQRYLDGATADAASRRDDARKRQDGLRTRVALVQIMSDTSGATIELDGANIGATPQERPAVVEPGPHRVSVAHEGRTTWTRSFRADGGGTVTLDAVLATPVAREVPQIAPPADGAPASSDVGTLSAKAEPAPRSWVHNPWIWTGVAAVVVAGVVTTLLLTSGGTSIDRQCGVAGVDCEDWK